MKTLLDFKRSGSQWEILRPHLAPSSHDDISRRIGMMLRWAVRYRQDFFAGVFSSQRRTLIECGVLRLRAYIHGWHEGGK